MNEIRTALLNFMICTFTGSILALLVPVRRRALMKTAVTAVLIFVSVSPLSGIDFKSIGEALPDFEDAAEYSSASAGEESARIFEERIRSGIENILINGGIDEYEIYVSTYFDEVSGCVVLEKAEIRVNDGYREKIRALEDRLYSSYGAVIGDKNNG